jgi:hypothetical protein
LEESPGAAQPVPAGAKTGALAAPLDGVQLGVPPPPASGAGPPGRKAVPLFRIHAPSTFVTDPIRPSTPCRWPSTSFSIHAGLHQRAVVLPISSAESPTVPPPLSFLPSRRYPENWRKATFLAPAENPARNASLPSVQDDRSEFSNGFTGFEKAEDGWWNQQGRSRPGG